MIEIPYFLLVALAGGSIGFVLLFTIILAILIGG